MIYTQANLQSAILGDNIDAPTSIQSYMNRAVREVGMDLDLRMSKRKARLSPSIYRGVFDYGAPSDMKDWALIDLMKQKSRNKTNRFVLTTNEEFDSNKTRNQNLVAIADFDGTKKLRVAADLDTVEKIIHNMDSLTADGTWAASGNASNLTRDADNFHNGSASLNFDVAVNFTSALLTNSTMDAVDLTDYENQEIFLWIWIPATDGLTSIKLRWGSASGDYWEATASTNNEGTAWYTGWNLVRFSWPATKTGTPVITAVDYVRIELVGDGANAASTDWRIDYLVARKGEIHDVLYYSRYLWQTNAAVYIENSTATTDYLNCETEEFEMFVLKGKQILFEEDRMFDEAEVYEKRYKAKAEKYQIDKYPSERMLIVTSYEEFSTLEDGQNNLTLD